MFLPISSLLILVYVKLLIYKTLSNTWFDTLHKVLYNIIRFHIWEEGKYCDIIAFVPSCVFWLQILHQDLIYYNCFIHREHRRSFKDMQIIQYFPHAGMTTWTSNLMPCETCIKQFYRIYFLTRANISNERKWFLNVRFFTMRWLSSFKNSLNHDGASISYEEQCTFAVTRSKLNFRKVTVSKIRKIFHSFTLWYRKNIYLKGFIFMWIWPLSIEQARKSLVVTFGWRFWWLKNKTPWLESCSTWP